MTKEEIVKKIKFKIKALDVSVFFGTIISAPDGREEKDKTPFDYKLEGKVEAYKEISEDLKKIISEE